MRWLAAFLLLWLSAMQAPVHAEDAERAALDDTLRRALAAYEAGELEQARALFEEVHRREPSARTLRGLGVVAFRQQRHAAAVVLLEQSLASPVKPLAGTMAEGVEQLLGEARQQIARLALAVEPDSATVLVDAALPERDASGALLLAPGRHVLGISAHGHAPATLEVVVAAGENAQLKAQLSRLEPVAAAGRPEARPVISPLEVNRRDAPSEPPPRAVRLRRGALASFAVAGAALVSTVVTTGLGLERKRDIEALCRRQEREKCSESQAREESRRNELPLLGALSIGGAIATAGAGLAGGGVWWGAQRAGAQGRALTLEAGVTIAF
jgi:hypothetical protein